MEKRKLSEEEVEFLLEEDLLTLPEDIENYEFYISDGKLEIKRKGGNKGVYIAG